MLTETRSLRSSLIGLFALTLLDGPAEARLFDCGEIDGVSDGRLSRLANKIPSY